MQTQQQEIGSLRLNVWAATLGSAITGLIVVILSFPLHLMHARTMLGERAGLGAPGTGVMPHPMSTGGGFALAWILVVLLVVLVYGGVAGAIFAAIYNAVLGKR
jgi:hypothetical protein